MLEIKRILFPVDFTKNSSKILPYVLSFADKYNATIYLIHVVQDSYDLGGVYVYNLPIAGFRTEAP